MDKIEEIIQTFNINNYVKLDINNLINILDNLTNIERNIIFNKLYYGVDGDNTYNHTFLQKIYLNCSNASDILIELLKKYRDNININTKNLHGYALLNYIVCNKDTEMLELICKLYKNLNVNILDDDNNNVLFVTIKYTNYSENIVKLLLEKNAKIQYKLLKYMIDYYNHNKLKFNTYKEEYMNILLEYLYKNNDYDYILEELYKYVIENVEINEDNKEFYDKIFPIKSDTKSAAKILAPAYV